MLHELEQTRNRLNLAYAEIAGKAYGTMAVGAAEGNPFLLGENDPRFSLYTCGLIIGNADRYLGEATRRVLRLDPSMRTIPDGFRHITLGELYFDENGRPDSINARSASQYFKALQAEFTGLGEQIELELRQVILAPDKEQNSLTLVAAFLPKNNLNLFDVKERIKMAVKKTGLPLQTRLNNLSPILCTLGRLVYPVNDTNGFDSMLVELETINRNLPKNCIAKILSVVVGVTTPGNYFLTDRHAFLVPPIYLYSKNDPVSPQIARPSWRPPIKEVEVKPKIKTAIFDFGEVLMDYSDEQWYSAMAEKSGLTVDAIREFMQLFEADMQMGKLSESEALRMLVRDHGGRVTDSETFFEITMTMRSDMINFVKQLMDKGYNIAVLTNTIPTHRKKIKEMLCHTFPELPESQIYASCEIGRRKSGIKSDTETDVFQFVLQQLGVDSREVVYLDDNSAYTHQARLNGIYAIDVPAEYRTIIPKIQTMLK